MASNHLLWSVLLGALSAVSLPLGAWAGIRLRPSLRTTALLAAFGAGALIAALTLELVAPTVADVHSAGHGLAAFWALIAFSLLGGLLFIALDHLLATRGAFLRKISTAITHFSALDRQQDEARLKELCAIPLLRALPVAEVSRLTHDVRELRLQPDEVLFREGDEGDALYMVRSGQVRLDRAGHAVDTLGAGGIFGELPLLTGVARGVTATALGEVVTLELRREDVARWRAQNPEFDERLRRLASERLVEIRRRDEEQSEAERRWGQEAIAALATGASVPTPARMRRASEEHEGAGLAVWLGILIDGIPESIVIGAGLFGLLTAQLAAGADVAFADVVPYALIAGLFLSNFPEALSSSLAMRAQGFETRRIYLMWGSLTVITALGAGVGFLLGEAVTHTTLVAIEGLAAGAMLTTIASTMIPEAVHLAGSGARVGLATLVGFLAATAFKLLE